MANLKSMSVEQLISLRADVERQLGVRSRELRQQLARLGDGSLIANGRMAKGSKLAGRKVAPKYRGPSGETWSGRGAKPRWMVPLLKKGKKLESFLIK